LFPAKGGTGFSGSGRENPVPPYGRKRCQWEAVRVRTNRAGREGPFRLEQRKEKKTMCDNDERRDPIPAGNPHGKPGVNGSVFTRQMAVASGWLVDVTDDAWTMGFRLPVYLSNQAWTLSVKACEGDGHQAEEPNLLAVLMTLGATIRTGEGYRQAVRFDVPRPLGDEVACIQLLARCYVDESGCPFLIVEVWDY
jgi:hypothetical protein